MLKSKNIILFIITLLLFSCKDNAQTTNSHKTTVLKDLNFDSLLKCSDYTYDEGSFLTADYGCIYNPKAGNDYGNATIYLIPKNKHNITDEQIISENSRVNNLSISQYKKEFNIYIFVIDKQDLNYNKSGDPAYYQKSKYEERAYTYNDTISKWILLDSINVLNESQNQKEQTWRNNIISKSNQKKEENISALENWKGIYLNSDDQNITDYKEIKDRIGWYEVKITSNNITYINDSRMESDFPTESPGGFSINYNCDYMISGNTIKLYEKMENDSSPPKNINEDGQKLVLELTKKGDKYYATSDDIKESENLINSIRGKTDPPYLFYKFDINAR